MSKARLHIKAFTVMDVLAGMVIMSIVIAMVYGVMTNINQQTHTFQKMQLSLNEHKLMTTDINREIDQCAHVLAVPNGIVLEGTDRVVTYQIKEEKLQRNAEGVNEILHPNAVKIETVPMNELKPDGLIGEVIITTKFQKVEMRSTFYKEYGVAELINEELINGD